MRYLKGVSNYGVVYTQEDNMLIHFVDLDYATDLDMRR